MSLPAEEAEAAQGVWRICAHSKKQFKVMLQLFACELPDMLEALGPDAEPYAGELLTKTTLPVAQRAKAAALYRRGQTVEEIAARYGVYPFVARNCLIAQGLEVPPLPRGGTAAQMRREAAYKMAMEMAVQGFTGVEIAKEVGYCSEHVAKWLRAARVSGELPPFARARFNQARAERLKKQQESQGIQKITPAVKPRKRHRHPPGVREDVVALAFSGMLQIEIAERLGVPKGTVSVWIAQAIKEGTLQRARKRKKRRIVMNDLTKPENLDLPPIAYGVSDRCGEPQVVRVFNGDTTLYGVRCHQTADELNRAAGVSKRQAAAMMGAARYGFDSSHADPANYTPEGNYKGVEEYACEQ